MALMTSGCIYPKLFIKLSPWLWKD